MSFIGNYLPLTGGTLTGNLTIGAGQSIVSLGLTPVADALSMKGVAVWDGSAGGTASALRSSGVGVSSIYMFGFSAATNNAFSAFDTALARNAAGVVEINNGTAGVFSDLKLRTITGTGAVSSAPARIVTTATDTAGATDYSIIFNTAATCTETLPAAASNSGRILVLKNIAAFAINSASANVVPLAGGAAATAILAATAGKFVILQSDGTNWQIMAAN